MTPSKMNKGTVQDCSFASIWYSARLIPRWLPGRTRFTRRLFKLLAPKGNQKDAFYSIQADNVAFFAPSLHEPGAASLILDGHYEPEHRKILKEHLPRGSCFVDVGANIGCHSFWASKLAGATGKVISIEASPYIFKCLQSGIKANDIQNIQAFNLIAGENDKQNSDFYDAPVDKFGMGSRSPQRFGSTNKSLVPTKSLDSLLSNCGAEKVEIIKIDVEGYEKQVIMGARDTIRKNHPIIIFEFCDWSEDRPSEGTMPGDAQQLLMKMGYKIYDLKSHRRAFKPLARPLTKGSANLLAIWEDIHWEEESNTVNNRLAITD